MGGCIRGVVIAVSKPGVGYWSGSSLLDEEYGICDQDITWRQYFDCCGRRVLGCEMAFVGGCAAVMLVAG